jgi:hypothetical protein
MWDFGNPKRVLARLEAVSGNAKSKKMAEELFAAAQKQIPRIKAGLTSWDAVAKYSMGSIFAYPTGKAFLLGVESMLRGDVEAREKLAREGREARLTPRKSLERVAKWLDSAVAVETRERSLSGADHDKLFFYRDCVKRYLDTGKPETECVPLEWANVADKKDSANTDGIPYSDGFRFIGPLGEPEQACLINARKGDLQNVGAVKVVHRSR